MSNPAQADTTVQDLNLCSPPSPEKKKWLERKAESQKRNFKMV